MRINRAGYFIFIIFASAFLGSCTAKKFVPEGKHLVTTNKVEFEGKKPDFSRSDLSMFITQRTNRSILGMRPQLWVWYITQSKTNRSLWRWINETIGMEPFYFEEGLMQSSATQMVRYANNVGYFNATVDPSVKKDDKLAEVTYQMQARWPYVIDSISYDISDTVIATFYETLKPNSPLKTGMNYNAYLMDDERDRITEYLKNEGFYYFTRDYILFEVDSNNQRRNMHMNLKINNLRVPDKNRRGEFQTKPHKRFYINQVNIIPAFNPFNPSSLPFDTVKLDVSQGRDKQQNTLYFYFQGDPRIRPQTFSQSIQVQDGEPYSLRKVRQTYRSLSNYRLFYAANITFDTLISQPQFDDSLTNWLDCTIQLQRNKVHSYNVDIEGTNSGGDLGIRGSLVYMNKNIFRGAEVFRFRINGGFEAQRVVTAIEQGASTSGNSIFNTTEFGADMSIFFPRFLSPVPLRNFTRDYQPKTNINIGIGAQQRQNYSRTILKGSFGYDWMASQTISHVFTPIYLSSIKISPSPAFARVLNLEPNQRIKLQYSNHLIASLRYSFIYNNQNINKVNDFFYLRFNFESAGNLISAFNNTPLVTQQENFNELFGIRYAQFSRIDIDFRYYRQLNPTSRFVFRTFLGLGLPYGNSQDMPFERSFYAGGANGMRGWQFRELGPGNYNGTANIERIGDIQIEGSAEYRFPIYSFFKGALFVDVGNIWTINDLDYLPGGVFNWDTFYKQFALDAGMGFRFDFSFFIFRVDAAMPLHNPGLEKGNRWNFNSMRLGDVMWQFGIGYPF